MSIHSHTTPENLERYAFLWSEARLVLSALTLLLAVLSGSIIPLAAKLTGSYQLGNISSLFWLISGAASLYLLYMWHKSGQSIFGGKDRTDLVTFFVSIVFGLNLGLAGLGNNIVLNIIYGMPNALLMLIFLFGAAVYLFSAWHLWRRWKENGEHLFGGQLSTQVDDFDEEK